MTRMSVGDGINEALAENILGMYGKYSWFLRYILRLLSIVDYVVLCYAFIRGSVALWMIVTIN